MTAHKLVQACIISSPDPAELRLQYRKNQQKTLTEGLKKSETASQHTAVSSLCSLPVAQK